MLGAAMRALLRDGNELAAMMAFEPAPEPVLNEPGRAIRAFEFEAAFAADGDRRIAAAVQEQESLLAAAPGSPPLHRSAPARATCRARVDARACRWRQEAGGMLPCSARPGECAGSGPGSALTRLSMEGVAELRTTGSRRVTRAAPPCPVPGRSRAPPACSSGRAPHRRRSARDPGRAGRAQSGRRPRASPCSRRPLARRDRAWLPSAPECHSAGRAPKRSSQRAMN